LKFKPDKKQVWLDWCEELKRRADEVIETLQNEGTLSEACFISQDGESVYYFMEVEDLGRAQAAFKNSTFKIDGEHRQAFSQSLERVEELTPLFHFQNRSSK
jgi:hypothetical protein